MEQKFSTGQNSSDLSNEHVPKIKRPTTYKKKTCNIVFMQALL